MVSRGSQQCQGKNKDGKPCSAQCLPGESWCHWHMPGRDAIRLESRQRGGYNRSREARAKKLLNRGLDQIGDIDDELRLAFIDVRTGKLDPKIAIAMASLARVIKDVAVAAQYEKQLEDLRATVAQLRSNVRAS